MRKWTVFVQQSNGAGTVHIASYEAKSVGGARKQALEETARDWGHNDLTRLRTLGIAEGDVKIVEWNDFEGRTWR